MWERRRIDLLRTIDFATNRADAARMYRCDGLRY